MTDGTGAFLSRSYLSIRSPNRVDAARRDRLPFNSNAKDANNKVSQKEYVPWFIPSFVQRLLLVFDIKSDRCAPPRQMGWAVQSAASPLSLAFLVSTGRPPLAPTATPPDCTIPTANQHPHLSVYDHGPIYVYVQYTPPGFAYSYFLRPWPRAEGSSRKAETCRMTARSTRRANLFVCMTSINQRFLVGRSGPGISCIHAVRTKRRGRARGGSMRPFPPHSRPPFCSRLLAAGTFVGRLWWWWMMMLEGRRGGRGGCTVAVLGIGWIDGGGDQ